MSNEEVEAFAKAIKGLPYDENLIFENIREEVKLVNERIKGKNPETSFALDYEFDFAVSKIIYVISKKTNCVLSY